MVFQPLQTLPELFEKMVTAIYSTQVAKMTLQESYLIACELLQKQYKLEPPFASFQEYNQARLQPSFHKKIMKKIKFIKDHKGLYKKAGDTEEYDTSVADFLIREGFAEELKPEVKEKKG